MKIISYVLKGLLLASVPLLSQAEVLSSLSVADITVTNLGGSDAASLKIVDVPTITSFTPVSGTVGSSVTIAGTNFDPMPSNNIVYFGATKATVVSASSISLTVTVPGGATYRPITVIVNGLVASSRDPFIVTFPGCSQIDSISFAEQVQFVAGIQPTDVEIGDIDGDGRPDVVVAIFGADSVFIYYNTGDSLLHANSLATPPSQPESFALGDMDGDGKLDIVVGNYRDLAGGSVSVFRNISSIGNISFEARVDFRIDKGAIDVALGDLDGDGKLDIVTANYVSPTATILRNTSTLGALSFADTVNIATGGLPQGIAIGDFDEDGKSDLAIANSNDNTVSVFHNMSVPGIINPSSFAPPVNFATGGYPTKVTTGDLDGDGHLDLVIANTQSNFISVLRGTVIPDTITANSFAGRVDFNIGQQPPSIAIGDVDGDGKPDIVVANGGGGLGTTVVVLKNRSTMSQIDSTSFGPKVEFTTGLYPYRAALGDLDGDSKPEIITVNYADSSISVLQNTVCLPLQVLSLSPTDISFGRVRLGQSKSDSLWLINLGNAILTVDSVTSTNMVFAVSPSSGSVSPLESLKVYVTFIPTSPGLKKADLVFYSNAVSTPDTVAVSGIGTGSFTFHIQNRWNMISVPLTGDTFIKDTLYPTSTSDAFAYENVYVARDTLLNGIGYWLKFNGAQDIELIGVPLGEDTIAILEGWNMIGSITSPLAVSSITSLPGGIVTSQFFGYQGSYVGSDSIQPGKAYWVKVNQSGKLRLSSSGSLASPGTIRIVATSELPPPPPDAGDPNPKTQIPDRFALEQNYPNPFNPSTTLSFVIGSASGGGHSSLVTLRVYDVLGREVARLVNEELGPGTYVKTWDATGIAAGIYFYRLTAGTFDEVKKMVIAK